WEEVVARIYPIYQQTLRRNRALDFDDLLAETLRLFDEQPDVLHRYQDLYRYVLVDEYQDTNRVQYLLVHALAAAHRNICVVGDPDQSIYGWRHADIRNILDFKRDYPDATEIHLELNYRSTQSIVQAADSIIRANTQRIQRKLRTDNPLGEPISIRELFDEGQEAQFVVSEIRRLTFNGTLRFSDCAVMYRTNAQSRPLEEAFIRSEIPYQLIGGTRFYERREIKDAMAILRLVANPNDAVSLQRVLQNTPFGKGIGNRTLQLLDGWTREHNRSVYEALGALDGSVDLSPPEVGSRAARLLADVYGVLSGLVEASHTVTLTELFDLAMEQTGFAAQFQDNGDPESIDRWENVLQLRAVLSGYDDLPESSALQTFLEESALVADADTIADSDDQVTLITLHAAKGLEFPVVFLVGAEEGILPHSRSMDSETQLEEERRLFYVGVTRAKQRVYISHVFRRAMYGYGDLSLRSRFIEAIPAELLDVVNARTSGSNFGSNGSYSGSGQRKAEREVPHVSLIPLTVGVRVFHDRFGDGVVLQVRDISDDQEVTVEFKRHGQKRLMASLANLQTD
ncbi:MAG: 3'-5' exonuclease, partial [Nitrolancea sp.]